MRQLGKIVILIVLVATVSSAAQLSKLDQEYMKSEENGKLGKLYSEASDLVGTGDRRLYVLAEKIAQEKEKFANSGSNLALCDLAYFYGPQSDSGASYSENYDLALKWLIEGEKKGLNCQIDHKWYFETINISEAQENKMTSLDYMIASITSFNTQKEIKKSYKYYYPAKQWIAEKKRSNKKLQNVNKF